MTWRRLRRTPAKSEPEPEKKGVMVGGIYGRMLGIEENPRPDPYGLRELMPQRPMPPLRRRSTLFGRPPNKDSFPT
jgi:hypothetical protein